MFFNLRFETRATRAWPVAALVILLCLLFPSTAQASDWQRVGATAEGTDYLDVSSVVSNGTIRTTWEKYLNRKADEEGVVYSVDHWRYDCSNRTSTLLSYAYYRADGTTVRSNQIPSYSQEAGDIVPDSIGEAVFKVVCG